MNRRETAGRTADAINVGRLRAAMLEDRAAIVYCWRDRSAIPVVCALIESNSPAPAKYVPLAILVNEYTTDLLNDLVPPPTLHGEWCWTHVPQKDPPPPLVPSEGDVAEGSEPA